MQGARTSEKLAMLEDYVLGLNEVPHLIVLNEHWLTAEEVKYFSLPGYRLISSFGRKSKRGGVLILALKNAEMSCKALATNSVSEKFETCGCEIKIKKASIRIIAIYRPSNKENNSDLYTFFDNLENLIEKNIESDQDLMIVGDLNVNLLNHHDKDAKKLIDTMQGYELQHLNPGVPTRVAESCQSLIDHFFSTLQCETFFRAVDVTFSDHRAVHGKFKVKVENLKDSFVYSRKYTERNWQKFYGRLSTEVWQGVYEGPNTNGKSSNFMDTLTRHFEASFPKSRTIKRANNIGRVNLSADTNEQKVKLRELGGQVSALRKMERSNYSKDKNSDANFQKSVALLKLENKLKTQKKTVGALINRDIKAKNDARVQNSTNKSSMSWNLIKENVRTDDIEQNIKELIIEGESETDLETIANFLNANFIEPSIPISEEQKRECVENVPKVTEATFGLSLVTPEELLKIIKGMANKHSSGWDGISMNVIKKCAPYIAHPLCEVVNCSFREGTFPENLKLAVIKPLFKNKGERTDPGNYRPIALTSSVAKVIEKCFANRIDEYFQENDLYNPNQHGFRRGKSTVTALFDMCEQIYESIDKREKLNLILYDFSNAFGCLVPEILLKKLECYGFNEKSLSWMSSFLTNRKQVVELTKLDETRTRVPVKSGVAESSMGVPQGTVLGPIGFTAYDNDLPLKTIIACLILFADDTSAIVKGSSYQEVNQKTVQVNSEVADFASNNCLRLNAGKTKIMQMHTSQSRNVEKPTVLLDDKVIEVASQGKILGVEFSDTLSWDAQCEKVKGKLRGATYLFVKMRPRVTIQTLRLVYFAYVQSNILYSLLIWGGSSHLAQVFIAQKRVLRALAGLRYWKGLQPPESCRPLFKEYDIMPVYCLYILECAKFVRKYPEKFVKLSDVPEQQRSNGPRTRYRVIDENLDLFVPETNLKMCNQNPKINAAKIYNKLPAALKGIQDEKLFVSEVKKVLKEHVFYDKYEYFGHHF